MSVLTNKEQAIQNVKELFKMGDCYCDEYSVVGMLNSLPSMCIENEKLKKRIEELEKERKTASISKIAMMFHELYGCSVLEGVKAHDIALEYLRSKATLKG